MAGLRRLPAHLREGPIGADQWFDWTPLVSGTYTIERTNLVETGNAWGTGAMDGHLTCILHVMYGCDTGCAIDQTNYTEAIQVVAGETYKLRIGNRLYHDFVCDIDGGLSGSQQEVCVYGWEDFGTGDIEITLVDALDPNIDIVCTPLSNHYLGDAVLLDGSHFDVDTGVLHLEATNGPASEFGFFLISRSIGSGLPLYQGTLCLDHPIGRLHFLTSEATGRPELNSNGQFDLGGSGIYLNSSGLTSSASGYDVPLQLPPVLGNGMMQSGEEYFVQMWYRDKTPGGASSANFSNTIRLTVP